MWSTDTILVAAAALGASWLRMGIALVISALFSLAVGIAGGTSRKAEKIIVPVLDILQSIPILGFFPLALYGFYSISPVIGAEIASIFLIFTSQAWNMTFAVYESTRVIGLDLLESARSMRLGYLDRLRYIYIPASLPRLLQNLQPSWSNGIFFLVGSEILTFGSIDVNLFGLGSVVAQFVETGDTFGITVTLSMLVAASIATNLLVFLPLAGLSGTRRGKETHLARTSFPAVFERASKILTSGFGLKHVVRLEHPNIELQRAIAGITKKVSLPWSLLRGLIFFSLLAIFSTAVISRGSDILNVMTNLYYAFLRLGPINIAEATVYSLIRVGIGLAISIGWSIPLALLIFRTSTASAAVTTAMQVASSIPVTILYPVISAWLPAVVEVKAILMILMATQWYVFFQVLGSLRNIPQDELEIVDIYRLRFVDKLRYLYFWRLLPALITGCVVAAGGAWNALVVAERIVIGNIREEVPTPGLGKLLSVYVERGDLPVVVIILLVMSSVVVGLNRGLWKRLYDLVVLRLKAEDGGGHGAG